MYITNTTDNVIKFFEELEQKKDLAKLNILYVVSKNISQY